MFSSQSFLDYDSVVCMNGVGCVCVCVAKPAIQLVKYKGDLTNHTGCFLASGIRMGFLLFVCLMS